MTFLTAILIALSMQNPDNEKVIYDFNKTDKLDSWYILDDGVMGGLSKGNLSLENGNGVFSGKVRLENNGGFSSVRHRLDFDNVDAGSDLLLRVKGDGKKYQVRIKDDKNSYYSYIYTFQTTGEWETIKVPLDEMYASFRGRRLDIPNYDKNRIEEIGLLIGNKRAEEFELQIEKIFLAD